MAGGLVSGISRGAIDVGLDSVIVAGKRRGRINHFLINRHPFAGAKRLSNILRDVFRTFE